MKRLIHKKIFEVVLTVPQKEKGSVEVLNDFLLSLGIPQEEIIQQTIDKADQLSFYCQTKKKAEAYVLKINRLKLKDVRASMGILYQDDWLTRWKKDWKPFALTRSLDVVPVWCREDYVIGKRPYILLDTISSFGTGLHETTRFMAQFIERLKGKFDSFLDVGTGTGILALVAIKCGAGNVCAIDLDEMCIEAAKANFKANGYPQEGILLKDLSKYKVKQPYDLVVANLVTHDLLRMKDNILPLVRPGGWLAVSGISVENLPGLKKGFAGLPLTCLKTEKGKCWTAVLYKRRLND